MPPVRRLGEEAGSPASFVEAADGGALRRGTILMKTTSRDLIWALVVAGAGAAAMFFALRAHWKPGDLDPGIEGCMTAGIVGFGMAMLHPLPYRWALGLCAPVLAAECLVMRYAGGTATAVGLVGIQLVIMGLAGLATALREPTQPESERARPSDQLGRTAHSL